MQEKAAASDFEGRFKEILSDPSNKFIPRVINAGEVVGDIITMHNGIMIHMAEYAYYNDFSKIFEINKGVHEPQEEYAFGEVLKYISPNSVMIELGAYWAFYSLWFQKVIVGAKNYLIEPDVQNMNVGKMNFELNRMTGDFTVGKIGYNDINMYDFVQEKRIEQIHLLHADIQGTELEMLNGAKMLFNQNKVDYILLSTHSQELHCKCIDKLKLFNYQIIASADFDNETFCFDGVLVAKRSGISYPKVINLPLRSRKK